MTGLTHPDVFDWILGLIKDKVTLTCKQMTRESHLLLVLMKIRLGNTNKDLAYQFRINYGMVSKIYRSWLVILSKALQPLIFWPSRGALRQHLPSAFKRYKNCACVIDFTEIFLQRPLNLEARAIAWSNYKHTNTIKYLIRMSLTGGVVEYHTNNWLDNWVRLPWLVELWRLNFIRQGIPYCRRGGNKGRCPCNTILYSGENTNAA